MKTNLRNSIIAVICAIIIVAGMVVGTISHFLAGGFFNYGSELGSYTSVVVTYSTAEYVGEKEVDALKADCDNKLGSFSAYEVSLGEKLTGGEIVYKFPATVDQNALSAAVEEINASIDPNDSGLNYAVISTDKTLSGGAKVLTYASIALAAAVVFQLLYFIVRYKLRAALTAFGTAIINLGVFVSLLAITRLPVGVEAVAISVAVVLVTMIASCIFLDRTRKNFKNEAYAKTSRGEVLAVSEAESKKINLSAVAGLAIVVVVLAVAAIISFANILTLAPYAAALLGLASCAAGNLCVMPALHTVNDALCQAAKGNASSTDKSVDKK